MFNVTNLIDRLLLKLSSLPAYKKTGKSSLQRGDYNAFLELNHLTVTYKKVIILDVNVTK